MKEPGYIKGKRQREVKGKVWIVGKEEGWTAAGEVPFQKTISLELGLKGGLSRGCLCPPCWVGSPWDAAGQLHSQGPGGSIMQNEQATLGIWALS